MYLLVVMHNSLTPFLFSTGCSWSLQRYAENKCLAPKYRSDHSLCKYPPQSVSKVAKSQPANTIPRSVAFQATPFLEAETTCVTFE